MKSLKKISVLAALVAVVVLASSCNRGVGCPTNFEVEKTTHAK
jgi:hypothetical protein